MIIKILKHKTPTDLIRKPIDLLYFRLRTSPIKGCDLIFLIIIKKIGDVNIGL